MVSLRRGLCGDSKSSPSPEMRSFFFCSTAVAAVKRIASAAGMGFAAWFLFSRPVESFSFDAAAGFGQGPHQQYRRPPCEPSDDPEYTCVLSHPPGAFPGEVTIYLSAAGDQLSIKIVVPGASGGKGGGGEKGWASLGFSPNGKMAGPSEAVVGFLKMDDDVQEPAVLRYRMNGYSTSSVVPLPERDQILVNEAVESTVDGSLVVRFQRPLSPVITSKQDVCAPSTMGDKDEGNVGGCGVGIASAEASEGSMEWLDPRNESVVVLWAYSSRDYWPSYHDATGAFKLPADSWRK